MIFYFLTVFLDPGYVEKSKDFPKLLQELVAAEYHLDYVCVYCENLRPENSDHCNFCNRCVQKFDHHCVFVNNCLGYRNHKWFICLLVSFTLFMVVLFIHSVLALTTISIYFNFTDSRAASAVKLFIMLFLIFVVVVHIPVVFLQLRS